MHLKTLNSLFLSKMHVQTANKGMENTTPGSSDYFELDVKDTTKWEHVR